MIIKSCTFGYHGANILVFRDLSKLFTAKGLRFNKFYSFIFHHNQPCGRRKVRGTRVRGGSEGQVLLTQKKMKARGSKRRERNA